MSMGVVSLEFSSMLDTFNRFHGIRHSAEVMEVLCAVHDLFCMRCCVCGSVSTLILGFSSHKTEV